MFIFIDESGQFSKSNGEQYFVVASFTVGNPRRTEKAFRSWQHSRFPRKMRNQAEIKFSEVKIDNKLRLKTIKKIADLDIRVHYIYLLRKNIPNDYWKKDRLESGLLYVNVICDLLEMYFPINDNNLVISCDQRHLKRIKRKDFKNMVKARLSPKLSAKANIQIEMIDSTSSANIQIADWIAGALFWYLEEKELGSEFYQILQNNLLAKEGKELFGEDGWKENLNPSTLLGVKNQKNQSRD